MKVCATKGDNFSINTAGDSIAFLLNDCFSKIKPKKYFPIKLLTNVGGWSYRER